MNLRSFILFFLVGTITGFAQDKKSKGDFFFFEYSYKKAIQEYKKEEREKQLTNKQYLNLADSYLKVGDYKDATKVYLEVFKKDSTMSNHHFNKMLQGMSRVFGMERVAAFLATKKTLLPVELMDNADFNLELLQSNADINHDYNLSNLESNSSQADFSPTFYNERLLFTSGRFQESREKHVTSAGTYLDIYIAKIMTDGSVLSPTPFTGIPNSNFHEATPYFSEALNEIFYVRSNADEGELAFDDKGKNALVIGKVDKIGNFEFLLKDPSTSFYYPFYHAASSRLYFAANFESGYGGTDIYYVPTNNGQIMSSPINLGPMINSPGNEISPYLFEGSLYFSSDVFYGLGGMDIYKTNIQGDGGYSIPINLGKGINSPADDFGFIIRNNRAKGLIGYFSSNRTEGKGDDDIYGFLVKEKPGLKTLVFRGSVMKPNSSKAIDKVSIRVLDENKKLIRETVTREDGTYQLEIPWRKKVIFDVSKQRYSSFSVGYEKNIDEALKDNVDVNLTFIDDLVEEKESQTVVKLNKFYFLKGKNYITTEIARELDKVVAVFKLFPKVQFKIESHTDSRGGTTTNLRLSQRRSGAIRAYLRKKGVPSSSILSTIGYGEGKITNNCKNGVYCLEMLHNKNERSLIILANYKSLYK